MGTQAQKPPEPVQGGTPAPVGTGAVDLEAALKRAQDAELQAKNTKRELDAAKARETALRARTAQATVADPKAQQDELRAQLEEVTKRNVILETATQFGLKPEDLEGDFQSPEEIRLHAQTLSLQVELTRLKEEAEQTKKMLTDVVTQVRATGEAAAAGTSTEGALSQVPAPRAEPRSEKLLKEYEDAAKVAMAQRGHRENEGMMRYLTLVHRDPTRIIGAGAETPEE